MFHRNIPCSDTGYGGYVVQKWGDLLATGKFSPQESATSSTSRELLAVKFILQSFGLQLQNENVQWFSDNMNVARIIEVGSAKTHLQKIAIEIYDLCMQFNIKLTPAWIPREFNLIADNLSKILDTDSWGIDFETFKFIQSKFGAFTYDRFADEQNVKVKKFNSKFHCIGSFGVNAFTFN